MPKSPMPWRILVACTTIGVVGGAILGFVLGLHHLPTLPFAIIEGAFLVGVPATVLGMVLGVAWWLAGRRTRRSTPSG